MVLCSIRGHRRALFHFTSDMPDQLITPDALPEASQKRGLQRHLDAALEAEHFILDTRRGEPTERIGNELHPLTSYRYKSVIKGAVMGMDPPVGFKFSATNAFAADYFAHWCARVARGEIDLPHLDGLLFRWREYSAPDQRVTLPLGDLPDGIERQILEDLPERIVAEVLLRADGVQGTWMHGVPVLQGRPGCGKTHFPRNLVGGAEEMHQNLVSGWHLSSRYDCYSIANSHTVEFSEGALFDGKTPGVMSDFITATSYSSRTSVRDNCDQITRHRMFAAYGSVNNHRFLPENVEGLQRRVVPINFELVRWPDNELHWEWTLRNREAIIAQTVQRIERHRAAGGHWDDLFPCWFERPGFMLHYSTFTKPSLGLDEAGTREWADVLKVYPQLAATEVRKQDIVELTGISEPTAIGETMRAAGWNNNARVKGKRVWRGPAFNPAAQALVPQDLQPGATEVGPSAWDDTVEGRQAFTEIITGRTDVLAKGPVLIFDPETHEQIPGEFFVAGKAKADGKWASRPSPVGTLASKELVNVPAVCWESDTLTIEEQLDREYPHPLLRPDVELHTGGKSIHCWLILPESWAPERARALGAGIARILGTDPTVAPGGHPMRLPGVPHIQTGLNSKWRKTNAKRLTVEQAAELEQWVKGQNRPAPSKAKPPSVAPVAAPTGRKGEDGPGMLDRIFKAFDQPRAHGNGDYPEARDRVWGGLAYCAKHGIDRGVLESILRRWWPVRCEEMIQKCFDDFENRPGNIGTGSLMADVRQQPGWKG